MQTTASFWLQVKILMYSAARLFIPYYSNPLNEFQKAAILTWQILSHLIHDLDQRNKHRGETIPRLTFDPKFTFNMNAAEIKTKLKGRNNMLKALTENT